MSYVIDSAIFAAFVSECLKILDCHDVFTNRNDMLPEAQVQPDDFGISLSQDDERRGLRRTDVTLSIQENDARYFDRLTYGRRLVRTVGHIPSIRSSAIRSLRRSVCQLQWFLEEVWPLVKDRGGVGKLVWWSPVGFAMRCRSLRTFRSWELSRHLGSLISCHC